MYFPLVFQIISSVEFCHTCCRTFTCVPSHKTCDWLVSVIYIFFDRYFPLTLAIHAVYMSLHTPPSHPAYCVLLLFFHFWAVEMLPTKASSASNVGDMATGPKADLPFGQETTVTSPTLVTPSQGLPTTSQQEFSQTSQLSSIEEDLAQVQGIVEKFEVESGRSLCVKGNLRAHINFWKSMGAPDFIRSIIVNGYQLPFTSTPMPVKLRNNKSARLNLDDGWATVQDKQGCSITAQAVRKDLSSAGFITNDEKSVWEPTQTLNWLGITWNSVLGTLKIVDRRVTKILCTIDQIIDANFMVSARRLASFTGQIISTGPVVGNIARIMTRHCVMSTLCYDQWDLEFRLDDYCQEELLFWKNNIKNVNSRNCFVSTCPSHFVYSDASATGCGSVIGFNDEYVCHKMWTEFESSQSSTWRELHAIEFSLQAFAPVLKGSHVKWFTDNQAAARIVEVGSMKLDLHRMARSIFKICIQSGIYLEVQWIPRTLNQQADYISRLLDTDDWQITDDLFLSLDARWGTHTVDCFANYYNHKLPKFFSRFWNPNTAGVDFFIQPLREENCWVVPPVSIVPRVLHYMKCQKAVGTVVVPFWPSAHFWPLVANKYLKYISDYSTHVGNQSLVHCRNRNSLLGSEHFKGYIVALRMEFID